jgi:hypothetical protein
MAIAAVVELCGVSSLAFAVGAYLPLSTTSPIFIGGLVKWLVDRRTKQKEEESEIGPGALFSSGLIAGGAITGILIAVMLGTNMGKNADGTPKSLMDMVNTHIGENMGGMGDIIGVVAFGLLAFLLWRVASRKE